jgi:type II secretory pathway pseudopilin PulG
MIAIAVLSVALVALLTKIHGSIDTARVTEYQNAARELAKQLMSDIEAGTVEDVVDGMSGNFGDPRGNYPELTWVLGRGETSAVGTTGNPADSRKLYDKRPTADNPFGTQDPSATDPAAAETEEPFTRVRILVNYPTADPERIGAFTLEKMLPTECVNGTRGLQDKKEKDAGLAAQEQKTGEVSAENNANNPGGGNKGGQKNSQANKSGSGSWMGAAGGAGPK